MNFLLRQSFDGMPIAAVATPLWIALVVIAGAGFFASRRVSVAAKYRSARWVAEICALIAIPILMLEIARLISAHNNYHDNSYASYEALALNAISALGVMQLVIGVILVWRHRSRLRSTLVATGLTLWWTAGVLFTASMAITGHWL